MAKKPAERRPVRHRQEALRVPRQGQPGKLEINPTKPMATQRDLSLAYSPGVAVPGAGHRRGSRHRLSTTRRRGNLVAVISNGTAILGLGDLGALASKPVMEGKAVLFKRFADVDSIDLEVDTKDVDEFINCVRYLGPSFGGINLEDIKAPDCFIIEQRLRELMDIPVFHDDQHGTAIIAAAGLINALEITGRDMKTAKLVCNGAGAAGIACVELIKSMGVPPENVILCDTKGVVYQGRTEGMNQWKSAHAVETKARTLAEAMDGADVFFGLSVKGALTPSHGEVDGDEPDHLRHGQSRSRDHAGGGRQRSAPTPSWRPAAPTIPTRSTTSSASPTSSAARSTCAPRTINDEMKIAAAEALAALAREDVPDEVAAAYQGSRLQFGPDYIIPVPFDPRLISRIPVAVAQGRDGYRRRAQADRRSRRLYAHELSARLDPIAVDAAAHLRPRARASPSASSSPRARRSSDPRRQRPSPTQASAPRS